MTKREQLAFLGGFKRPRNDLAQGTHQAGFQTCQVIAAQSSHREIHLYSDSAVAGRGAEFVVAGRPPLRVFEKLALPGTREKYAAVYVNNGEQLGTAPFVLRPEHDWAPVILTIGTAHSAPQWQSLLVALASGAVRGTDGFIFKSKAAMRLFERVWDVWRDRFGFLPFPRATSVVIPNGTDVHALKRSPQLRAETRRALRIPEDAVVFLAFSRLSPGTKGDQLALIARWKIVAERFPNALLLLSGAQVERAFVMELRSLARAAGVGDQVLVLENPFELFSDARGSLMSAADVFVHVSTGVEETSPLVVHEAMAHSLPIVATDWAGVSEIIDDDIEGYLIATHAMPMAPATSAALFGGSDLRLALAASQSAVCAFDDLVDRVCLFRAADRRSRMGAAARARAERWTLAAMARAHLAHVDRVSAAAERAWTGDTSFRPLVDFAVVLEAQARRNLSGATRVRATGRADVELALHGCKDDERLRVKAALASTPATLGALSAAIAPSGDDGLPAGAALAESGALLVRLLNFGALEILPETDTQVG